MKTVDIAGDARNETGRTDAKKLRKAGVIPCVIYGGKENIHFSAPQLSLRDVVYTAEFKLANISVNGETKRCILKEVQFDPLSDKPRHVDFIELDDSKTVIAEIPLKFKGVSPGVKKGGKLVQKVRKIKVKTTPENLVDQLFVDISGIDLGQSVRVKDVEVSDKVQVMNNMSIPVASIEIPRALRSATAKKDAEAVEK